MGCEADHSSQSSANIKNAGSYTSIHPYVNAQCLTKHKYVFVAWYLLKHKDYFTYRTLHKKCVCVVCVK